MYEVEYAEEGAEEEGKECETNTAHHGSALVI